MHDLECANSFERYNAEFNGEFMTIQEVARYWRECINQLGEVDDMRVAYDMVNIAGDDHFEDWYQDGETLFAKIFELAAELELPDIRITSAGSRADAWKLVHQLFKEFELECS